MDKDLLSAIILIMLFGLLALGMPIGFALGLTATIGTWILLDPHATLSSVRYRFRDLDSRLQRLERYVTSNRFRLDREFRELRE